jgi:hypothetical protein
MTRRNGPKIRTDDNFARGCLIGLLVAIPLWFLLALFTWWLI